MRTAKLPALPPAFPQNTNSSASALPHEIRRRNSAAVCMQPGTADSHRSCRMRCQCKVSSQGSAEWKTSARSHSDRRQSDLLKSYRVPQTNVRSYPIVSQTSELPQALCALRQFFLISQVNTGGICNQCGNCHCHCCHHCCQCTIKLNHFCFHLNYLSFLSVPSPVQTLC